MARGRKSSLVVSLSAQERSALEAILRRTIVKAGIARRARMVLLRAEGYALLEVARRVEVAPRVVYKWIKPWRHHMWLSPKHPRDAEFYARVSELIDLYTRPLDPNEVVLSIDEKTSLQPRPRLHATKPAQCGGIPNRVEHEYRRDGALNLFAAFNTRTGRVYGKCFPRKRQKEFIAFLEHLDAEIPETVKTIHIVCDNVSTHHGKEVRKWLESQPRFVFHFTPVHCSWMNQVEQWFSILQRKRFRIADFESKADLEGKINQFIAEWNQSAEPFNWTCKSAAKIMAAAQINTAA